MDLTTRMILGVFAVLLGSALCENLSAESPDTAAILSLEGDGVPQQLLNTLGSIVRNEAQQIENYEVVNKYEISFDELLLILDCPGVTSECLRMMGEQLGAKILVYGNIWRAGNSIKLRLEIHDAQSGRTLSRLERTATNDGDVIGVFRAEITDFFALQRRVKETQIRIGSNRAGARVFIDDTYVGDAPYSRLGLPAGRYRVSVRHPDAPDWQETLDLKPGADIKLWAELGAREVASTQASPAKQRETVDTKVSSTLRLPETRRAGASWGGWSAVAIGTAALVGSGVFAFMISRTEDDVQTQINVPLNKPHDLNTHKKLVERFEQLSSEGESYELAHRVLLFVGALGVASGAALILWDSSDEEATIGLTPSGVVAVGRF
jgi:hypothetical protein